MNSNNEGYIILNDILSDQEELKVKDVFADASKIGILKLFADTKLGELEDKFKHLDQYIKNKMFYKKNFCPIAILLNNN